MNGKDKRFLRGLASEESAVVMIGKSGLTNSVIDSTRAALMARELIKVKVLNNAGIDVESTVATLAGMLGAELVQVIGHNGVIFKKKRKESRFTQITE